MALFRRERPTGPLADFAAVPAPEPRTPLEDLPVLAVDVETTGLKPKRDTLLSIGWVPVNGDVIDLSGAGYVVLQGGDVGDSATIHHLTDDQVALGVDTPTALAMLLEALAGRAMVAHFAAMETGFLSHACRRYFGAGLRVPVIDTFALERRRMERIGTYPRGEDLRLPRVRRRYGLPFYRSHNALTDALGCAELYLAFKAHAASSTLKDLQG